MLEGTIMAAVMLTSIALLTACVNAFDGGIEGYNALLSTFPNETRLAVEQDMATVLEERAAQALVEARKAGLTSVEKQLIIPADHDAFYDACILQAEQMTKYGKHAVGASGWEGTTVRSIATPNGSIKVTLTTATGK
jgi:hypothetical protein